MATAYKSPGVYIEEIPKFPPSVAPVETAIPALSSPRCPSFNKQLSRRESNRKAAEQACQWVSTELRNSVLWFRKVQF